jgi:hypothetical protein
MPILLQERYLTLLANRVINLDGTKNVPVVSGALDADALAGTYNGVKRINGVDTYDGIDDYMQLPAAALEAAGWDDATGAVVCRIGPVSGDAAGKRAFSLLANSNNRIQVLYFTNTNVQLQYRAGAISDNHTIVSAGSDRRAVGMSWGGGNVNYFSNAAFLATKAISGVWAGNLSNNTVLGASDAVPNNSWDGTLSDFLLTFGVEPNTANMEWLSDLSSVYTANELDSRIGVGKWAWYQ